MAFRQTRNKIKDVPLCFMLLISELGNPMQIPPDGNQIRFHIQPFLSGMAKKAGHRFFGTRPSGLQISKIFHDFGFGFCFFVNFFDHFCRNACNNGMRRHILRDDRTGCHNRPFSDAYAFQDHSIRSD